MLNWAKRFNTFCFLDNHQYQIRPHSEECLLAAGVKRELSANAGSALKQLQDFIHYRSDGDRQANWLFGHLGYDLKNEIEDLSSDHFDGVGFPDMYFFEPEILIRLNEKEMIIESNDAEKIFNEILNERNRAEDSYHLPNIQSRLSKEEYIDIITQLRQHILRGDCYEINFCQEFFAENTSINPVAVYKKLSTVSPNPFSALYKINDRWLICASPERFLKKEGNTILSQPIKGTSQRIINDKQKDEQNREELFVSSKDRSENVMVVDLVRNDLSKVCKDGTVKVDELYGIYSFPQVHQMISTVSGELRNDISFTDIIRATFPMGSMTGAPKKRVMELIEQYEKTKRAIFSGAVGYISPGNNFDFNVVIRSIMYNAVTKYLSFQAGSGIIYYSDPEKEWEECLLKAEAIKKVLSETDSIGEE
ncbi:MAG: anthranilate synthase component I family protein [Chitinophagaceae bacterium]|nr:anthranilate synthase component I family protein [Chitinophagaceae bacterium]